MTKHIIIITTASSQAEAEKIAAILLENSAAACVQQLPIKSSYRWKGKIEKSDEILLLVKTRADLYDAAEKLILENHSYETPEIIAMPIETGFKRYLDWIDGETK